MYECLPFFFQQKRLTTAQFIVSKSEKKKLKPRNGDNWKFNSRWYPQKKITCFLFLEECIRKMIVSGLIHCGENRCMSQVHMCDGVVDCPWGQDERNCCEYLKTIYYFYFGAKTFFSIIISLLFRMNFFLGGGDGRGQRFVSVYSLSSKQTKYQFPLLLCAIALCGIYHRSD